MRNRFDDLARTLVRGTTRRETLRGLGFGLAAVALTPLGLRRAAADNDACAHFCHDIFPPGPEQGHCTSAAALCAAGHAEACAESLCHQCGPAQPGNRAICGPEGSPICCAEGEDCLDGECGGCSGFICGGAVPVCGDPADDCFTLETVEGTCECGQNFFCETTPECATSAECGDGFFCQAVGTGCCSEFVSVCVPVCPSVTTVAVRLAAGGRTNRGDKAESPRMGEGGPPSALSTMPEGSRCYAGLHQLPC